MDPKASVLPTTPQRITIVRTAHVSNTLPSIVTSSSSCSRDAMAPNNLDLFKIFITRFHYFTLRALEVSWLRHVNRIRYLGVVFLSGPSLSVDFSVRQFYAACNSIFYSCKHTDELIKLQLMKSYCLCHVDFLCWCYGIAELWSKRIKCLLEWLFSNNIQVSQMGICKGSAIFLQRNNVQFHIRICKIEVSVSTSHAWKCRIFEVICVWQQTFIRRTYV